MQRSALVARFTAAWSAVAVRRAAAGPAAAPTFTRDVAPILYNSCVSCHRAGEVAPMSLVSFEDVRPWAKSVRLKVSNREMPPWGADPRYGKFKDDRSLTSEQIETIVNWVDAGAPKGSDADLPPVPKFASGWSRGEPDVVIEMPVDFEIPAEGQVPVIDFFSKSPFTSDVFIKALEIRPGTPGVVHHAGVYVVEKLPDGAKLVNGQIVGADGKPMSRNEVSRANGGSSTQEIQKLLSFVPGRGYEEYQGDAGQLIKAGSYSRFLHALRQRLPQRIDQGWLVFREAGRGRRHQIFHSFGPPARRPTSSRAEYTPRWRTDQTRDEGGVNLPNIPPYAENWKVVSVHTILEPITLYGLTPHLHLRGKSMKYLLTEPDGREKVLLDVPNYDFNWQLYYELQTPRKIAAGSKVTVVSLFDNSVGNRYNPAPEKEVFWSEQSWDEMYAPQARITVDNRELKTATAPQQK